MAQQKSSKSDEPKSAKERCGRIASDSCVQTIVWMLLTLGLCAIGIVLYMAVRQPATEPLQEAKLQRSSTDKRTDSRHGRHVNVKITGVGAVSIEKQRNAKTIHSCPHTCCGFECLGVAEPAYELTLAFLINRTVRASIENYNETASDAINIIWFGDDTDGDDDEHDESDEAEDQSGSRRDKLPEHNCTTYKPPFLVIEGLKPNTTYTFCMLDKNRNTISPLSCQALYVPIIRQNLADEQNEEKEFSVGIICLIFSSSALVGAVIAYLSISSNPDLLEGSKNVLVVKNSNKTSCATTNMDGEYRSWSTGSTRKRRLSDAFSQSRTQNQLAAVHSNSYTAELKSWSRRSAALPKLAYVDDGYEVPKLVDKIYSASQKSVPNNYAKSPSSPPPLPKRKSNSSSTEAATAL